MSVQWKERQNENIVELITFVGGHEKHEPVDHMEILEESDQFEINVAFDSFEEIVTMCSSAGFEQLKQKIFNIIVD